MERYYEAVTRYDHSTVRAYYGYYLFRNNKLFKYSYVVAGAGMIAIGIGAFQTQGLFSVLLLLGLMGLFCISYPFWIIPLMVRVGKKCNKRMKAGCTTVTFYPDHMEEVSGTHRVQWHYGALRQVLEEGDVFYFTFHTMDRYFLMVDRKGFTLGHPDQLVEFLQQGLPGCYRKGSESLWHL